MSNKAKATQPAASQQADISEDISVASTYNGHYSPPSNQLSVFVELEEDIEMAVEE
jgi:hypothetical protein